MTKNNRLIAGAIVLAAGVATYIISRKRRNRATMNGPQNHQPHTRHVTGVFSRAKSQMAQAGS